MKISHRIIYLILSSCLSVLLVGGFSLYKMSYMNDKVHETSEFTLKSIQLLEDAEAAYLRARSPVLSLLLEQDPTKRTAHYEQFQQRVGELRAALKQYEQYVAGDPKDQKMLQESTQATEAFVAMAERVMSEARAGHEDKAKQTLDSELRPLVDRVSDTLSTHARYNYAEAKADADDVSNSFESSKHILMVACALAALVSVALGVMTLRSIAPPLASMRDSFKHIGQHLDLTLRAPVHGKDEIAQTAAAFNTLLSAMQASLKELTDHAQTVATSANKMSSSAQEVSVAASRQSESSSSIAATMEQMTVSISHVADRAGETDALSSESGAMAQAGGQVIHAAVEGINAISSTVTEASQHISILAENSAQVSAVVGLIQDMADQTNLLALNAAIEAARAGEQGRGFAVVADEVRKLAERTTKATQEIREVIAGMQNSAHATVNNMEHVVAQVETGVSLAQQASQSIQNIGQSAERTVLMVGDISKAIREQGVASTNIARQVESIAQMSEENCAIAQSIAHAAQEMAQVSHTMQDTVRKFKV